MKSLKLTPKPLVQRPSVNDVYEGQYWIMEHKTSCGRQIVLCTHIIDGNRRFLEFGSSEYFDFDASQFEFVKQVNLYGVT